MVILPPSSYSTAPPKKLPSPNLKDVMKIYPSSSLSSPSSTTSSSAPPKKLPSPNLKDVMKIYPSSSLSSPSSTTSSTAPPKKLPSTNLKDVAKINPSSPTSSSTTSSTATLVGCSSQLSTPKMIKKPSKMRKWLRKIHMPKILKGFNGITTITPTNANRDYNLPPIAPLVCPLYIPY